MNVWIAVRKDVTATPASTRVAVPPARPAVLPSMYARNTPPTAPMKAATGMLPDTDGSSTMAAVVASPAPAAAPSR